MNTTSLLLSALRRSSSRLRWLRCAAILVAWAPGLGSAAATAGPGRDPAAASAAEPATALREAHRNLRRLDRFLDHHPLIENDLRNRLSLIDDKTYLELNPALAVFLQAHPAVAPALHALPRHLLHRALLREARVDLRWSEVSLIDPFLDSQPDVERELDRAPELITTRAFLLNHPRFASFLATHQPLRQGFLADTPST